MSKMDDIVQEIRLYGDVLYSPNFRRLASVEVIDQHRARVRRAEAELNAIKWRLYVLRDEKVQAWYSGATTEEARSE